jgi:integrase
VRGTVRKRGNTWSVIVDLGVDGAGKRQQKWKGGFRTKREAETALNEFVAQLAAGTYVEETNKSVGVFLGEWLPAIRGTVRPSTWRSYATNIERHAIPRLGSVPLRRLSAPQLNAFYEELLRTGRCDDTGGLSPRTVRYTHVILHRALRDAVRWGLLARNPADLADPPKQQRPEVQVWDAQQLRQFLEHVGTDRLAALWVLLATTGMRRGEALGLRWRDVDLEAGRASIAQTLGSWGGQLTFAPPKTAKSRRSISLDAVTISVLRRHRKLQLEERLRLGVGLGDLDLVFTREDGSPVRPDSVTRQFGELSRCAGLPKIRLHDLRHTYATIALTAGAQAKVVAERLGHSTIGITLDTYSHVMPALEEETAARIARLIVGS